MMVPVVITACLVAGPSKPTHGGVPVPLGPDLASQLLIERLVAKKVYPHIPKKCLFAELEEANQGYFRFTVRFDPGCTGTYSESSLLDRFAILRHSGEIVWWDVADPEQFKPFSTFLRWTRRTRR